MLGVLYAVVLAGALISVWEGYAEAREIANREADDMVQLSQLATAFPTATKLELRTQLHTYAESVINKEWDEMAKGGFSLESRRELDGLFKVYAKIKPRDDAETQFLSSSLDQLDIISDSRWDMTYLGMQVMVEGLALAAFGFMHQMTTEPLLKQMLRYVMSDEARHVAFGVLSLQDYYKELSDPEIFERQQFAFEAAVQMRDRFLQQEVWERMDVPVKDAIEAVMRTPTRQLFQMMLFSKIVPNCKKLGLPVKDEVGIFGDSTKWWLCTHLQKIAAGEA